MGLDLADWKNSETRKPQRAVSSEIARYGQ